MAQHPWWSFKPHQNEYFNLGQILSDSAVTFDRDQLEPLILSAWPGVNKTFGNGLEIGLVMQAQSEEIDRPDLDRTTRGGLVASRVCGGLRRQSER